MEKPVSAAQLLFRLSVGLSGSGKGATGALHPASSLKATQSHRTASGQRALRAASLCKSFYNAAKKVSRGQCTGGTGSSSFLLKTGILFRACPWEKRQKLGVKEIVSYCFLFEGPDFIVE